VLSPRMHDVATDPSSLESNFAKVLAMPFLVRCGFALVSHATGRATGQLVVSESLAAGTGRLNGTELYGLLDCAAWCAVASTLAPDEAAVTHDAHFSLVSVARLGSVVTFDAKVEKRGRSIAFVTVEARADGSLFARATVTKSIVPLSVRMRHAPARA